jgi:hypothetical protein
MRIKYCPNCGSEVHEIGLGLMKCNSCKLGLIPFIDLDDNQAVSFIEPIDAIDSANTNTKQE